MFGIGADLKIFGGGGCQGRRQPEISGGNKTSDKNLQKLESFKKVWGPLPENFKILELI